MSTALPTRRRMDERVAVAMPAAEKRKLFEVAAESDLSASEYVRGVLLDAMRDDKVVQLPANHPIMQQMRAWPVPREPVFMPGGGEMMRRTGKNR